VTNDRPEDGPPAIVPRSYPAEGKTLRPPPEKVAEINVALVKHEAERSAEVLQALQDALPQLATKQDIAEIQAKLAAVDSGVSLAIAAGERAEAATDRLRADLHLWLFGDGKRPGIAQGVEANNKLAKDALEVADKSLRVAQAAYDAALHGPAAEEGKRGSGAPELEVVGSGRPAG